MTLTEIFDLSGHNTLGLASFARYGQVITDVGEIAAVADFARARGLPFHVLGGGSNCVLGGRIDAVVAIMGLRGRSIDRTVGGDIRLTVRAGEDWADLVAWTVGQGIGGLENLAGIPGTVGAAPIQNIGAYGVELRAVFETLTAFDTVTGDFRRFGSSDCRFGYRHSRFKDEPGRYVVTEVTLRLPQPWRPVLTYSGLTDLLGVNAPRTVMDAVLALRRSKLPDWRVIGNAGSFFHNPIVPLAVKQRLPEMPGHPVDGGVKLSAGWLIEACGLKGYRCGGAGFSEAHALVMVNHGHATFEDVTRLAALAVEAVESQFGITLVREPVLLA